MDYFFSLTPLELMWITIGVIVTILGTLVQVAIPGLAGTDYFFSLQLGGLLLSACLGGAKVGFFTPLLYLGLGLAGVQVFSQGGGLGYVQEPAFGYLVGFIPAGWICGSLAFRLMPVVEPVSTARSRRRSRAPQWQLRPSNLKDLLSGSLCGLMVIHGIGITYLVLRVLWGHSFWDVVWLYSVYPLLGQLIVLMATCLVSLILRRLLLT
jgi:biotin transport system substrate-specific component